MLVWEPILPVELLLVHFVVKERRSFELNVIVLSDRLNGLWRSNSQYQLCFQYWM